MDREKIIKALECRKNADKRCGNPCEETGMCHYATAVRGINGEIYKPFICDRERICTDAIALLKEQEADKPKGHWEPYEPDKRGYTDGFTCTRCERVILSDHYCKMIDFDFCPYCGAYMDNAEGR